jgi:hypothetical protein
MAWGPVEVGAVCGLVQIPNGRWNGLLIGP